MNKVNISEKLNLINDYWNPRIAGELNEVNKNSLFSGVPLKSPLKSKNKPPW